MVCAKNLHTLDTMVVYISLECRQWALERKSKEAFDSPAVARFEDYASGDKGKFVRWSTARMSGIESEYIRKNKCQNVVNNEDEGGCVWDATYRAWRERQSTEGQRKGKKRQSSSKDTR